MTNIRSPLDIKSSLKNKIPVSMKEARSLNIPEINNFVDGILNKTANICACMGAVYGDPYCPCVMQSKGIPISAMHERANDDAKIMLKGLCKLFNKNNN
jgi:hypothetical protein